MGSGWTGALGTGSLATHQEGFYNENDENESNKNENKDNNNEDVEMMEYENEFWEQEEEDAHWEQSGLIPILNEYRVVSASCGWGHSAVIVEEPMQDDKHQMNARKQADDEDEDKKERENRPHQSLYISGRPQDFQALLRLQRLPTFVTDIAVQVAHYLDSSSLSSSSSSSAERNSSSIQSNGIFSKFTFVPLPNNDIPIKVVTSAGLTLILGLSKQLYSLGLNHHGQAGIGRISNNVWKPTPISVQVLSSSPSRMDNDDDDDDDDDAAAVIKDGDDDSSSVDSDETINKESFPSSTSSPFIKFQTMALGLQHGLAIDMNGILYSWGKGNRGQLGHGDETSSDIAKPIMFFRISNTEYSKVIHVAAGFNHSACVTEDSRVWIWGKNVTFGMEKEDKEEDEDEDDDNLKTNIQDSFLPIPIKGLPNIKNNNNNNNNSSNNNDTTPMPIEALSCGSHHTSILLQDGSIYAVGITTDTREPILDQAVCILPPTPEFAFGNVRQFECGMDRTTIVSGDGSVVKEVLLWSGNVDNDYNDYNDDDGDYEELDQEVKDNDVVMDSVPACVSALRDLNATKKKNKKMGDLKVVCLSRGWLHSLLITE